MRLSCLALLAFATSTVAAHADTLNFTYTFSTGDTLSASLQGTLQPDGNTFQVSGYNSVTYDGKPETISADFFQAYSDYRTYGSAVNKTGVLTLDGSYENFIDYDGRTGYGFDLIVNAGFGYSNGKDIGVFGFSNLGDQPFVASNFVASVNPAVAATPEPSSLALLGTGLLGLVGVARKRFT